METVVPTWAKALEDEDWQFLKRFLLASGSLKALAEEYGISYPTVRNRLDRLIAKVQTADEPGVIDEFHRELRILVAEQRLPRDLAKRLLEAHRDALEDKCATGQDEKFTA